MIGSYDMPGSAFGKTQTGRSLVTRHAWIRGQQRALPPIIVDALLGFGDRYRAPGGCWKVHFTKKSWRRWCSYMGGCVREFDRYKGCYLIESGDGQVVTQGFLH